ncbi:MAG TPA: hypothetical protein PL064_12395, partial [Thermogutta sp.]|nr:hypothetical protein [Thermogutta sp.]
MLGCQTAGVGDRTGVVPAEGGIAGGDAAALGALEMPLAWVGSPRTWGLAAVGTRGEFAKSRGWGANVAVAPTGAAEEGDSLRT